MQTPRVLLKRYANIKAPKRTKQKVCIDAVKHYLDITLQPSDIVINKDSISINTPAIIRAEIQLHQKEILTYINEQLGEHFERIY